MEITGRHFMHLYTLLRMDHQISLDHLPAVTSWEGNALLVPWCSAENSKYRPPKSQDW